MHSINIFLIIRQLKYIKNLIILGSEVYEYHNWIFNHVIIFKLAICKINT